jgi:hypothetical protein
MPPDSRKQVDARSNLWLKHPATGKLPFRSQTGGDYVPFVIVDSSAVSTDLFTLSTVIREILSAVLHVASKSLVPTVPFGAFT